MVCIFHTRWCLQSQSCIQFPKERIKLHVSSFNFRDVISYFRIYRCWILIWRTNKLLLPHILYSGANHIPLFMLAPFLLLSDKHNKSINIYFAESNWWGQDRHSNLWHTKKSLKRFPKIAQNWIKISKLPEIRWAYSDSSFWACSKIVLASFWEIFSPWHLGSLTSLICLTDLNLMNRTIG